MQDTPQALSMSTLNSSTCVLYTPSLIFYVKYYHRDLRDVQCLPETRGFKFNDAAHAHADMNSMWKPCSH